MIGRVAMLSLHTSPLDQPGTGSGGGMNVYVRELARALGSADVEVDIFTRSSEGALVIPDAPHVQVIALPMGPAGPLAKGELEAILPDCVRAIRDYAAATGRPHALVHSHYWLSGLAGIELAGAWSVPLVHMFHTLSRIKTRLAGSAPDPRRARGEARVLRAADAVVVANQVERAQILDLYRAGTAPLVTIPCGIDPAPFEAAHTAHRGDAAVFCIAALGRAERLKHFDLLLHAVAVACRREPAFARAVRVQLAGGPSSEEPETLPALQRLASTLGIADRVAFLGPVAHAAVPALYAGADVCVVPSRYESFGLVALEAMAAGLPVVATRVGGLQLTVEDGVNGFLVGPDDRAAMADRLLALWRSPTLRATLGARGVRAAHQYAWPAVAERVQCLYDGLAGRSLRVSA